MTHWREWEKAKKDMATDGAAKQSALDEALKVIRGAKKDAQNRPNAMQCPRCGNRKFKTLAKGERWACRACGELVSPPSEGSGQQSEFP